MLSRTSIPQEVREAYGKIPEEMAARHQWVGWRYGHERPNGKREKPPINPRADRMAKPDDPATWGSIEAALRAYEAYGLDGIGFVFTEDDPYTGVDLDGCRNPETGEVTPWATRIITAFGSYTEVSPSGTGVKIIARGRKPEGRKRRKSVEAYDRERYFTITGDVLEGHGTIEDGQEAIEKLQGWLDATEVPQAPREAVPVALGDEELLEKARSAANGARFRMLYDRGDTSGYGSDSEAVMALTGMLAFWTGRDPERMERLFAASALGDIPKWRDRPTVVRSTVEKAIAGCGKVYDPHWKRPDPMGPKADKEVLEELAHLHALALADPWTGRTGPGERWVLQALLTTASTTGTMTEEGVVVPASSRHLAPLCGKHRQRVEPLLKRLVERGWARLLSTGKGSHGSGFLLTAPPQFNCCQRNTQVGLYKGVLLLGNTSTPPNLCVSFLGNTLTAVLARVRNPPPQIEAEYDKNGRRIVQESRYLLRDLGDMGALLIEKVAARPGMDLAGLAGVLGRDPSNVRKAMAPIVEGGFIEERDGGYFPAGRLDELVERHLEYSGSNDRERKLRKKYREDRERYRPEYEERLRKHEADRLRETALACGVPEEELERPADGPQKATVTEDPQIGSVADVLALARSVLGVIPPEHREDPPYPPPLPGRDPLVHLDTEKARAYRASCARSKEAMV